MGRIGAAFAFGVLIIGVWIGGLSVGSSTDAKPKPPASTLVASLRPQAARSLSGRPFPDATPSVAPRSVRGATGTVGRGPAASAPGGGAQHPARQTPSSATPTQVPNAPSAAPSPQNFAWMHCDSRLKPSPIDPHGVTVVIPRLGVQAPVYDRGVDREGAMVIAPGYALTHLNLSAKLGTWDNYVVYGHDDIEQCVFHDLADLRVGDIVEFYHGTTRYTYVVTASDVVDSSDVRILDHTDEPIATLISCYPVGIDSRRIVVISNLVAIDENATIRG